MKTRSKLSAAKMKQNNIFRENTIIFHKIDFNAE